MGATGTGKTYLACALGMAAVRNFMKVRYVRLPELFTELAIARGIGSFPKVIQQVQAPRPADSGRVVALRPEGYGSP